jgi:hypothetical protein
VSRGLAPTRGNRDAVRRARLRLILAFTIFCIAAFGSVVLAKSLFDAIENIIAQPGAPLCETSGNARTN